MFAAGTWGTQKLLHRMKATGVLRRLPARLGVLTRTNSEAIIGAARQRYRGEDRGVAITSSFYPDEDTHIEPTRYGPGSNAMGSLGTLAGQRSEARRELNAANEYVLLVVFQHPRPESMPN